MVPSEALAGLAGVALFAAPGAGLAEILPAVRELPSARRLAYSYLLGIAWTAGWLYALSHWLAVPLRSPAILIVAAVPVLAGMVSWLRRRGRISPASSPSRRRRLAGKLALAAGALISLALLCDALDNPLTDWDGRMTWSAQARYVRSEGTVHPTVLAQRGWYVAHPWYPLLMPVAQVAVLEVTHADPDHQAFRPMYAAFFPVWLLLIYSGAETLAGRNAAAWAALCAALLSFPAFAGAGGAASAYSDLPLACFFGAGLLLLLKPRLRLSAGLAAGILLAAAVLTKAEGEILAPVALGLAIAFPGLPGRRALARWRRLWRRRRRALVLAVLPAGLGLILLLSWRAGVPESFESFEQATSWPLLWPGIFTRIPRLAWDARAEMVSFLDWGLFWSAAPLVLIAGWRGLRRRPALPLFLAAAVPLGVGWLYATISLRPDFVVRTTWNRFLLQASVPLLVLFALALRDLLRRAGWLPRALRPSSPRPSSPAPSQPPTPGEEGANKTPHHPNPLLPSPSPRPGEEGAKQERPRSPPLPVWGVGRGRERG